jgi:protoporphyrinogen oxidase
LSTIVLGAGLSGLSAAHHLGGDCEVFESAAWIGGHSHTHSAEGFSFDEGAHVFFGEDDISTEFVWEPLKNEIHHHQAEIWNHYDGQRFGRYPVQANAAALDSELATQCVLDFITAAQQEGATPSNYEEWCYASFGRAFADNFMLRYARKVWTVEPSELTTEWLGSKVGGRISRPSLEAVLRGAIDKNPRVLNYLTRFGYPAGGFGRIAERLGESLPVKMACGLARLDARERTMAFTDGSIRSYKTAISTIPLPALVSMAEEAPEEVRLAAQRLMWTSLRCVNLGVERADIGPGHWVYFYDHNIPFFRISFPSKFAPGMAPPGHSSISCEIAYSRRKPLDAEGLVDRVIMDLRETGVLRPNDRIVSTGQTDSPYAYVVFDHNRNEAVRVIHEWMEEVGLIPCGRFAEWGYQWSFEAIECGRRAAARVRGLGQ